MISTFLTKKKKKNKIDFDIFVVEKAKNYLHTNCKYTMAMNLQNKAKNREF